MIYTENIMKFVQATDPAPGIKAMALRISDALNAGRKVLWLVCGGSNISTAVKAMELVRQNTKPDVIPNLTVGLTDERYGTPGHKNSNWQQLVDAGFNMHRSALMPVLIGKSLEATVRDYADRADRKMAELRKEGGFIIALFGIGTDGHIAGILPETDSAREQSSVSGYMAGPYIRVTLTAPFLEKIDAAHAFAYGAPKAEALKRLLGEDLTIEEQPAQLLKKIDESYLYSDNQL